MEKAKQKKWKYFNSKTQLFNQKSQHIKAKIKKQTHENSLTQNVSC